MRLGVAKIKIDGELLESLPGAKIDLGGKERTAVTGSFSLHGFAEKIKPAQVECEISLGPKTDLKKLSDIVGATIQFECDTGQTYVVNNAFNTVTAVVTEGEGGKIPLVFQGDPAELS
jgi:hypothetical protein